MPPGCRTPTVAPTCCRWARRPGRLVVSAGSRRSWLELLGFAEVSRNSMDAVSDRDFLIEHLAALSLLAMHLSRLAEELVLWSSAEFGFSSLDEAFTTGSSIMPQKRNPDVAELLRGKTGRVYGALQAVLVTLKGLPMTYNRDLQEDKAPYFEAVDVVHDGLALAAAMMRGATWQVERLAAAADDPLIAATDLADHLTRRGLPFRQAHEVGRSAGQGRRGRWSRSGRFFARRAAAILAALRGQRCRLARRRRGRRADHVRRDSTRPGRRAAQGRRRPPRRARHLGGGAERTLADARARPRLRLSS